VNVPAATTSSAASIEIGGGAVVDFTLPNLGEGVESADVAAVLVKTGDVVSANQPVLEPETEKAVMEVPCPHAGRIEAISVKPGDKVRVGQGVLKVRTTSAAGTAPSPAAKPAAGAPSQPSHSPAVSKPATAVAASKPVTAELVPAEGNGEGASPIPAAPSTRRLARKLGVELRTVRGTGPGGRITQDDVQDHVRGLLQQKQLPAVARTGGVLASGSIAPPPLPDFSRFGLVERQALNKIARTAAENLTVSWNVIPHVTQHDRCDITELEGARKRFGQGLGKNGPKVTMTAIAIKALTTCLQAFPKFNSSLDPETNELVFKRYYHIGCAVDTPNGLLVPVVKDCDKKSILEIAAKITELAEKARDRKLSMDDMQGATCTVTNLGGIGGTAFTPIVNYPEVCILGMARSQNELQLVDGQVKERLMLPLALSYDHRVINGADAARFVASLCQMLSDPFQLLSAI
jgi:pyruvate dehydrogenase E2 component (dihydrolipoamide acetyltransferase)